MHLGPFAPLILFALVIGLFVFRAFKYGGIKASFFGAPILRTVGEFQLKQRGMLSTTVRVHALGSGPDESRVGLEISEKTIGSFNTKFFRFSRTEAEELVRLLEEAAREVE